MIPTVGTLFRGLFPKPIVMTFDQRQGSSDGGALLLRAIDLRLGLIARLAACVPDTRQPGKVAHDIAALVAQRVYGIACGYADANDAARLAHDPIHKLLLGRDPLDGPALASQPTLSRFENSIDPKTLYRMAEALADHVIERHRRRLRGRVKRVTIDLDPTDDPTHGAQQLTFFNSHYDAWCYLPLVAFLSFNKERAQYLVAAVLRPGNAGAKVGAIAILERLLTRLRRAFPQARIRVRLDGGFAGPDILTFLDAQPEVDYVVAMAKNDVLLRLAEPAMKQARRLSKQIGRTAHVYGEGRYAAQSWHGRTRRVIFKAEVVRLGDRAPKDNPRFVLTNIQRSARWIYRHVYCERGDVENRIKELHDGVELDRTSCARFLANQFRVLLTATAYVLLQELRLQATRTECAQAQVATLRERLLKLGARVERSVRRIVIHLPAVCPFRSTFQKIAWAIGGMTT
jgi:hypothetical protein